MNAANVETLNIYIEIEAFSLWSSNQTKPENASKNKQCFCSCPTLSKDLTIKFRKLQVYQIRERLLVAFGTISKMKDTRQKSFPWELFWQRA